MQGLSLFTTVLFIFHHGAVIGNPVSEKGKADTVEAHRGSRLFPSNSKNWSFHYQWALPPLPSFSSVSSFFGEDEDEMVVLKKRVKALEKSQREIHEYLRSIGAVMKPGCEQKPEEEKPADQPLNEPSGNPKPEESNVTDDKEVGEVESALEDKVQSATSTEKGEETPAPASGNQGDKEQDSPVETDEGKDTVTGAGNAEKASSAEPGTTLFTKTTAKPTEEMEQQGTKGTTELPSAELGTTLFTKTTAKPTEEMEQQGTKGTTELPSAEPGTTLFTKTTAKPTEEMEQQGTKGTTELPSEAEELGKPQTSALGEDNAKPLQNNEETSEDKQPEVHESAPEKNGELENSSDVVKIDNARPEKVEGSGTILLFTE